MRLLGYTRVSTRSQDAQLQVDALVTAGVEPRGIFADVTSGSRTAMNRPGMRRLLEHAVAGERVNAGIVAARESGTRFGRPPVDPTVIAEKLAVVADARAKGRTAADAARLVGRSRATLYRHTSGAARTPRGRKTPRPVRIGRPDWRGLTFNFSALLLKPRIRRSDILNT